MPYRYPRKKRACAKIYYVLNCEEIKARGRSLYQSDPDKMKVVARTSYGADPKKKKAAVRASIRIRKGQHLGPCITCTL